MESASALILAIALAGEVLGAELAADDSRHRDLVAAVLADFARLSNDG